MAGAMKLCIYTAFPTYLMSPNQKVPRIEGGREIVAKMMFPNENLGLSWKTWKVAFTKFKMYFPASHLELFKIEQTF